MSYTYRSASVPKISSVYYGCHPPDSNCGAEEIQSPLSYSDAEDAEEEQEVDHATYPTHSPQEAHKAIHCSNQDSPSMIKNKRDLVSLMILLIYQNLQLKFKLDLGDGDINLFCNLFTMLITKSNSSFSQLMKNSLILEKILANNFNSRKITFGLLKRMVLLSFIIGSCSTSESHDALNFNQVDFTYWSQVTGLSEAFLQNDCKTLLGPVNAYANITESDIAHLNAIIRYQVSRYVKVM